MVVGITLVFMMLIRVLSISVHVAGEKWQIIILRTINIVYIVARRWTVNDMSDLALVGVAVVLYAMIFVAMLVSIWDGMDGE